MLLCRDHRRVVVVVHRPITLSSCTFDAFTLELSSAEVTTRLRGVAGGVCGINGLINLIQSVIWTVHNERWITVSLSVSSTVIDKPGL
jgi:hypothetical protein